MKVCFIATEFFGWGIFGGFGRISRTISTALAKNNVEVHVLMPKSWVAPQPNYSIIDGVRIHAFGRKQILTPFGIDHVVEKLASRIDAQTQT